MTETILPHELPSALGQAPAGIKVLSLDCFDTLLWRDCHLPSDLFSGLEKVLPMQRSAAEAFVRKAEFTRRNRSEVGLGAIYDHAMPNADSAAISAAITDELDLEASTCFAFEPTVELMREAKARGLKVIIVSDTYLDVRQLTNLIRRSAGDEVVGLIDRVFASSQTGISKSEGLLAKALKAVKCKSSEALHIGDNPAADYDASRALGVPARLLLQFTDDARQRLRFERACQSIGSDGKTGIGGLQMQRALIARDEWALEDPAQRLGYSVLGPVFHAYENWLREEADDLQKTRGATVHWLFMLRDGHLPFCVHSIRGAAPSTARVEISRYAATAAALTTKAAYDRHVALEHGLNPSTLAKQMLFTPEEIIETIGRPQSDEELSIAAEKLLAELRNGNRRKTTIRRARDFADRLIGHVRAAVDPQPGDTLMLVDLGYNGSAQNQIDGLLSEAFDCHVAGRYLLLREMAASGLDKLGMLDARNFSTGLLEALCGNVAVIEQLATCEMGSVIDYTKAGDPVRKASSVKGRQSNIRDAVQQGVTAFAKAALEPPVIRNQDGHSKQGWRETAANTLTRFLFLPQPWELEVLKDFEHDVNMGSERVVPLFDPEFASEGIRRRGLFYMKGSARMFLPAELAREDMATRLSLFLQKRYGLGLTFTDHAPRSIALPAFYVSKNGSSASRAEARATHDGCFTVQLPVGSQQSGIALGLGAAFEWVEVVSVTRAPIDSLRGGLENDDERETLMPIADGMNEQAAGLYECPDPTGLLFVPADQLPLRDSADMIEIVLRPIRERADTGKAEANTRIKDVAA
ncbi:MAG: HAD family hydrolase [Pseudomonadota bacterium]